MSASFDIHAADAASASLNLRWGEARNAAETAVAALTSEGAIADGDTTDLVSAAVHEAVGLGPLDGLIADEGVVEIMVEGAHKILVDRGDGLTPVEQRFSSAAGAMTAARRMALRAGSPLEAKRPVHETALPYGPHITIVQPPVAVRGVIIEVRRRAPALSLDDLVASGMIDGAIRDTLAAAVGARRHVWVVGETGSGVTSLVGALANTTGEDERLVTVEDVPDLSVDRDRLVSLSAGGPGSGIDLGEVVEQGNRLRCDRLVVDDVKGPEAFKVLTTVASRGGGCFVGVHAAADDDALQPIRILTLLSGAPEGAVSELLARGVHLIVSLGRVDGGRRVVGVTEITGVSGGHVQSQDLFDYEGSFVPTGAKPTFV